MALVPWLGLYIGFWLGSVFWVRFSVSVSDRVRDRV